MPRLSAKGIDAEATISKLSTIIQPTLANKIARAEGKDRISCEPVVDWDFCEEREKIESAIIFKYANKQKTRRLYDATAQPFKKYNI